MTNTTTPAARIAPSGHKGRWSRRLNPGAHRSGAFTAAELAAMFDGEMVVWEYSGTVGGQHLYHRSRYVPQSDGSLAGYAADGQLVIIHPADRPLRILTK